MKNVAEEFKAFVARGNLIEVAVGLVMALAFKAVIDAFVNGLIMPIVGALFGHPSFDQLTFTINDSVFLYGTFITQTVTFLLVAAAIFFFVVKPYNVWKERHEEDAAEEEPAAEPEPSEDIVLLREIRDALRR